MFSGHPYIMGLLPRAHNTAQIDALHITVITIIMIIFSYLAENGKGKIGIRVDEINSVISFLKNVKTISIQYTHYNYCSYDT